MLTMLILNRIHAWEKTLGSSLDYLRFISSVSRSAFFKFLLLRPLASHRRRLPTAEHAVASLTTTLLEDCGTCVQIEVNLAKKAGLEPRLISAVLRQRPEELPQALADVFYSTKAVVEHTGDERPFREKLRGRFGDEGLVDLGAAITMARVFPTMKRALGFAASCSLFEIGSDGEMTPKRTADR